MSNSFEKIDYRMRPAKSVERRMMAAAFLRLRPFHNVEGYQYVGMGSVYFSDFSLFHDVCGFETMISIEAEDTPRKRDRFKFNAPLGHIDLRFGHSNNVLPVLAWDLPSVVWLDYDGALERSMLTDIHFLADKLSHGSLLCISVNAGLGSEGGGANSPKESRLETLIGRVVADKIPFEIVSSNLLKPADVFPVYREILAQELKDGLAARNAGRPQGHKITYEQIMFFRYQDGAPMLTIGWVIFEEDHRRIFDHCSFATLPFFKRNNDPFVITPPLLTSAEIREIDRCDEKGTFRLLSDLPLPEKQVKFYQAIKRYWSTANMADLS